MTPISRLYKLVNVVAITTDKRATTTTIKKELKINRKESSRTTTIKMKRVAKKEARISSSKRITTRLLDRER